MAVVFILLISFAFINKPETSDISYCNLENTSFKVGEKLVYKAYYNWQFVWVPAGEAIFEVQETKTHYEIKVTGKTYSSYDYFFKVRDFFYSRIDKNTLLPNNFVRIVEEGNYRKFDSIVFDHKYQKATSFNGTSRATAKAKVIPFEQCTHDLLSVLYFMRNINITAHKVGDHVPVKMLFDEETYPIKVLYTGKESKKDIKGLGKYNTVTVVPDLVSGTVFKDGNKMKVWVSDDNNKIPLLIESPLAVGTAKAILKSYSGQRHPMTSKVK
ncbi:MAG: DUF3108 domain-containing protein [Saprospiraceae bacterium]